MGRYLQRTNAEDFLNYGLTGSEGHLKPSGLINPLVILSQVFMRIS